jgi:hypothetical protein
MQMAKEANQNETASPIVCPPRVALPEFIARLPERQIRPEVREREGLARQRVNWIALQVLDDGGALVRVAMFCRDWVMHDLK